jgi:hypothetical protein
MASATKCRAADDLLTAAELHPSLQMARHRLWQMPALELVQLAIGAGPLPERAIALWYVLGINPCNMLERRGEPQLAFDAVRQAGFSPTVVATASEAFRKLRDPLCAAILLLHPLRGQETATRKDDPLRPERVIRDVPCWAYDVHTREGRAALQSFLRGTSESVRWVRAHVPGESRIKFLGSVVFRIEGGLVRSGAGFDDP